MTSAGGAPPVLPPTASAGPRRPRARQLAAIAAAAVLAAGVLWFDWPVYWILALYWLENVAVGIANLGKLLFTGIRLGQPLGGLATTAFFSVHYGMFCAVHGVFVATMFGGTQQVTGLFAPLARMVGDAVADLPGRLALLAIVVTVLLEFAEWLARHRDDDDPQLLGRTMGEPYGRVVVLHFVILGGGFLMQLTGAPQAAVLLLVALKLAVDLGWMRLGRPRRDAGAGAS